jgi:hypothetical protein
MAINRSVDEIIALVGARDVANAGEAWRAVEAELGLRLPSDLKQLMSLLPTGMFCSFIEVASPVPLANGRSPFLAEVREALGCLQGPADMRPYPVHPKENGIVPWARTVEGDTFYWLPDDPDPDRWSVVFADCDFTEWHRYPGTATQFLADLLTGRLTHPLFDEALEGLTPSFATT